MEGSSWLAETALGCKVGGAVREGASRSRRCTEVEGLSSGRRNED